ncbi:MAG TPA: cupin domain-containing protein [Pirellulales bacterium]|jgi:cupin 2 domain-containing protein|nr:cupin domain-containing protein [Pirellulales bacterium]
MPFSNLFDNLPARADDELITPLVQDSHVRIERIVSHGQASPPGFWYDQDRDEWFVVLRGAARLQFDREEHTVEVKPGDFLTIPAHRRHRVEWTTPDEPTVWLAVHFGD